jgi:hypothetical protein
MLRHLAVLALIALPALAQDPPAPFTDEAAQDPDFLAWRATLITAVAERDTEAVVAMAAPDIQLSNFGDVVGHAAFAGLLRGDPYHDYPSPHDAAFYSENYWHEFERLLALGGTFDGPDRFHAPYTQGVDITPRLEDYDPAAIFFVIGHDRPLFAEPDTSSEVIAEVSEVVVVQLPYDDDRDERPNSRHGVLDIDGETVLRLIGLADGTEGYMRESHLRSILEPAALFERREGIWQIALLFGVVD